MKKELRDCFETFQRIYVSFVNKMSKSVKYVVASANSVFKKERSDKILKHQALITSLLCKKFKLDLMMWKS